MPIYEYQCQGCNHELEKLQKISDEPLSLCPQCGEPLLKRKISAAGFRLKGGGWYETDFKSGGKKNLAGDSGAPAASGGEKAGEKAGDKSAPAAASSSTTSSSSAASAGST
jgi:putative FmdB family regulatory protein